MRLYEIIGEKRLANFLKKELGLDLAKQKIVELNEGSHFHGDFIVVEGYKFKKIYSKYQVMETPTKKHEKPETHIMKCRTDSVNYFKKKA